MQLANGESTTVKIIVGDKGNRVKIPLVITKKGTRLWLAFPYNKHLIPEVKASFSGYKWHGFEEPPIKQWSVDDCQHNWFQINFLSGQNPYADYDSPLVDFKPSRPEVRPHQVEMASHFLTRHYCIAAAEMGTGKTLAAIEVMEQSGVKDWIWVAPKVAIKGLELEMRKWKCKVMPTIVAITSLKKYLENWPDGKTVHQGFILDESSRTKNPATQMAKAASYLANAVRREHGPNGFVILMSGSPAPKAPTDWYSQCEIACPGFIREGSINKFKERLAIIHERENTTTGGIFPQLVSWRDDDKKCSVCGEYEESESHDPINMDSSHQYTPSINEVANLYNRIKCLTIVKTLKDCTGLPDKTYRRIYCEPSKSILRAASMITKTSSRAITALTLLRELSDGFQYRKKEVGKEQCKVCFGNRTLTMPTYNGPAKTFEFLTDLGLMVGKDFYQEEDLDSVIIDPSVFPQYYINEKQACPSCNGSGECPTYETSAIQIDCPKEDALIDLLEEHEDSGRLVVFAGFTGSLDRIVDIGQKQMWDVIRLDGSGWSSTFSSDPIEMVESFQAKTLDKCVFVGHPMSAGMSLTLTASRSAVYWSNDFNAESRIQSEGRIHRMGMDENVGATIIDLIHLPTDEYILENLAAKRDLQSLSLGQITQSLERML